MHWLLACCVFAVSSAASADLLEEKIDAFVANRQSAPGMGVAVGVVRGGRLEFFKGYGMRDRANRLPVASSTLFAVGSTTKAFTSLAALMLEEQGAIDLAAPIAPQLPGFALSDASVASRLSPIDMLSHRSGLPGHDLLWYLTPFSRAELLSRIGFLAMNPRPGMRFREGFQYNNLMYMAVGSLIERASGQSWESFIDQRVLRPLEMASTTPYFANALRAADLAKPYVGAQELAFRDIEAIGPAGSLFSSVEDLAKWVAFHLRGGTTADGRRLVSPERHARLFEAFADASGLLGSASYGLGWFRSSIAGKVVIWHPGNIDGFSAFVSFCPEADVGLIILANADRALPFQIPIEMPDGAEGRRFKALPYLIYEGLLDAESSSPRRRRELARQEPPISQGPALAGSFGNPALLEGKRAVPTSEAEELGRFDDPGYGEVVLIREGDALVLQYYANRWTLEPSEDGREFSLRLVAAGEEKTLRGQFERSAAGEIEAIRLPFEESVGMISFRRRAPP